MNLLSLLGILLLTRDVHRVKCNGISVKYVNIWDTVILPCHVRSSAITMRWRRGNDTLSQEFSVNSKVTGSERYTIVGSRQEEKYNLQIMRTTENDNGTYICESQLANDVIKITYVLIVKVPDRRTSTETNMEEVGKETGSSFREFHYVLLVAGLILVICLSALCNTFFNRTCPNGIPKTTGNIDNNTETHIIENTEEHSDITERNKSTYGYETINERDMLPSMVIAMKESQRMAAYKTDELTRRSYLEIVDTNLDDIQPIHKDTTNTHSNMQIASTMALQTTKPVNREMKNNNKYQNISSLEDAVDVTGDDDYLHPYVALKTDEMEYLHGYSTPVVGISNISAN